MLCLLALFSALLCSSLAQNPDLLTRFGNTTQLSASPLYELYWNVTGNRITFAVHVETEGWVGFGISPTGLMLDSDVIMGFVDDTTGVVTFTVSVKLFGNSCFHSCKLCLFYMYLSSPPDLYHNDISVFQLVYILCIIINIVIIIVVQFKCSVQSISCSEIFVQQIYITYNLIQTLLFTHEK